MIASSKAGNIANFNIASGRAGESPLQIRSKLARPVQMATHIRTNTDFRPRRRHKMKMRIKTGDAVNLIKRSLRSRGQRFKLRLGQEPVAQLDGPQIVKNHGARLAL